MPVSSCRFRLSRHQGDRFCTLDGHPCATQGADARPPEGCPRLTPGGPPCPACAAAPRGGPPAPLLADRSDAAGHPATGGRTRYVCPACGYTAEAAQLARGLLEPGAAPREDGRPRKAHANTGPRRDADQR
jgi:hypothetical protein